MKAQSEEDDRIDAELQYAAWCDTCDTTIGYGECAGCIAAGEFIEPEDDDEV